MATQAPADGVDHSAIWFAVWVVVPTIFFNLVATKMQGYTYFTAPAMFLLSAYFLVWLYRRDSPYNDIFFLDVGASYNIKPVGTDLKKLEKELTIILVEGN